MHQRLAFTSHRKSLRDLDANAGHANFAGTPAEPGQREAGLTPILAQCVSHRQSPMGSQLGCDGHTASRPDLPPDAPGHRQAGITSHTDNPAVSAPGGAQQAHHRKTQAQWQHSPKASEHKLQHQQLGLVLCTAASGSTDWMLSGCRPPFSKQNTQWQLPPSIHSRSSSPGTNRSSLHSVITGLLQGSLGSTRSAMS